jgi:hypothetical protein
MDNEQFFLNDIFLRSSIKRGLIKFDGTRENIQMDSDNTDLNTEFRIF